MIRTDAVVNSLGPADRLPLASTSFLVLRVRKPWSLSHAASWLNVVVPIEYRLNISATAAASEARVRSPAGCSLSHLRRRSPLSLIQQDSQPKGMPPVCLPKAIKDWSLRSLQVKLIKIGGRLVRHARRLVFQLAEVAVPLGVFRQVLQRIGGLHPAPG